MAQQNTGADRSQRPQGRTQDELLMQSPQGSGQSHPYQDVPRNAPEIMVHGSEAQQGAGYSQSAVNLSGHTQTIPSRPAVSSVNTAPTTVPSTLDSSNPYATPARSATFTTSHSHSRSSPAGMDQQKYLPFVSPTTDKYVPPPGQKYSSHTLSPMAGPSNAPLELSDIRPRADTGSSAFGQEMGHMVAPPNGHLTPWPLFSYDWCKWPVMPQAGSAGKMAVGSYLEDGHNYIHIYDTRLSTTSDDAPMSPNMANPALDYVKVAEATHSYPVTRMMWEPPPAQKPSPDLLATSGDHLRLWSLGNSTTPQQSNSITSRNTPQQSQKLALLALLSNSKTPEHTAPLTSLDWNSISPNLIITSSIDTTCTIWDIPSLTARTQLIAHDKEVYDVRFCANSVDMFVSCGADGSVRMFDLRSLEHSTIIYEPSGKNDKDGSTSPMVPAQTLTTPPPLLRLATSPHDAHLLATFAQDSSVVRILDVRQPGQALLELRGHFANVNTVEWSRTRRGILASGADDCLVLLWDLINQTTANASGQVNAVSGPPTSGSDNARAPAASWRCDFEVSGLSWAPQSPLTASGDMLGVAGGRGIYAVKL